MVSADRNTSGTFPGGEGCFVLLHDRAGGWEGAVWEILGFAFGISAAAVCFVPVRHPSYSLAA